jgi:hypothetical protein
MSDPTKHFFIDVLLDGEFIHKIQNLMKFSREMGYPDLSDKVFENRDNLSKDGALLAESKEIEFSNNADANNPEVAFNACFQLRVTKYLIKNSEPFKEKYGDYYASLKGSCESFSIINSANCNNCHMHPINNGECLKA